MDKDSITMARNYYTKNIALSQALEKISINFSAIERPERPAYCHHQQLKKEVIYHNSVKTGSTVHHDIIFGPLCVGSCKNSFDKPGGGDVESQLYPVEKRRRASLTSIPDITLLWFFLQAELLSVQIFLTKFTLFQSALNSNRLLFLSGHGAMSPLVFRLLRLLKVICSTPKNQSNISALGKQSSVDFSNTMMK
jgi:hypothetical protein